jgi:hypothetical protein
MPEITSAQLREIEVRYAGHKLCHRKNRKSYLAAAAATQIRGVLNVWIYGLSPKTHSGYCPVAELCSKYHVVSERSKQ